MRYVFMDLDGTITNSQEGITKSVQYALDYFGVQTEDLKSLCRYIGPPLLNSFMDFAGFKQEMAEKARDKYRERYIRIGWMENEVYEGIEEGLKELKEEGCLLVIATSKPEEMAKRILEHFGLAEYFTYICGAGDNGRSKKAEVIRYALKLCNITDTGKVMMVGDTRYDIEGAKETGLKSMGVLYGFGTKEELVHAQADYIAETVQDMIKILKENFIKI